MGRRAEGWKLHWKRGIAYVRFTYAKKRYEITTGERDSERASERAASIYASFVAGGWRPVQVNHAPNTPIDELCAEWLAAIESDHDDETVDTYKWMARNKFIPYFKTLDRVNDASIADYVRMRLKKVTKKTVLKEIAALFGWLRWCKEQGVLSDIPARPEIPKRALGVRSGFQRRAPVDISPEQAAAIIAAMPELSTKPARHSTRHFAVRPRFIVAWETGLRPGTLNALSVPEHYTKGATELRISDDIDKARFGRVITLTPAARAALDSVCPDQGLIFGTHTYWPYLKRAAKAIGLPDHLAKGFAAYDFRHGRAHDLLHVSGNMPGTAYILGHKLLTTTNKYITPAKRQGDAVISMASARPAFRALSGAHSAGDDE